MEEFSVIGKSMPLMDGVEKVTGEGSYGVDAKLSGMIHGRILRSPYPHAKIRSIDTSEAEKLPGIYAVVSAKDMPDRRVGVSLKDETIFAREKVRYVGEAVAAVAAADIEMADRALEAIRVEYEELEPVFEAVEAMRQGAPVLHENLGSYEQSSYQIRMMRPVAGSNVASHIKVRTGDIAEGFQEAAVILENTFRCHRIHHCYMEPHAVLVDYKKDKTTIWTNGQRTFDIAVLIAGLFNMPVSKVRVINTKVGGGFGGKITARLEPVAMALSKKARKPVKIVLTRQEEFTTFGGQHSAVVTIKSGATKDGRLTALEMETVWDAGAYTDGGISVASLAGGAGAPGPYRIPNLKIDSYLVYTNKPNPTALRGMGMQQVAWAVESQMDLLAEKLGMDPVEFRLKNAFEEGDRSATGEILDSVSVKECITRVAEALEWNKGPKLPNRGKAICAWHKFSAPGTTSSAVIKVNGDGSVILLTGATEIGQGSNTVLAQIVAEELGINVDDISVTSGDTDATPFDHGTFSSRVTHHTGNAVRSAALDAKRQMLEIAAQMLQPAEVTPEALDLKDRRVFVKRNPEISLPFAEVALSSRVRYGTPILGKGSFRGRGSHLLDPETGQSDKPAASEWVYMAQGAEVEVDRETGEIKIVKLVGAYDAGKAINPISVKGQLLGGMMMGVGLSLFEEMVYEDGRMVNPSFMDYLIPTAQEAPPMEAIIVEKPHPAGPYGAKGIGETSIVLIAPAIGNAFHAATGVRIKDLPLLPHKVLSALEDAEAKTA